MKEKIDFYSKLVICVVGALVFGIFFVRRLLLLLLPFLIAWAIAFAVRKPAERLSGKLHLSSRALRSILSVLICSSVLVLLFLLLWRLLLQGWKILSVFAESRELAAVLERVMNPESMLVRFLPEGLSESIAEGISSAAGTLVSSFASFAAAAVSAVPSVLLFILVSVISAVYFSLDLEKINAFVRSKLNKRVFNTLSGIKSGFLSVGIKYVRAYAVIMLMTFGLVFVGLLLLGVDYAFLISVIVALLDILPVIGVGTVLIPWGIFQIFFGSRALGIGLIILFVVVEIIRQITEPRIIGKNLGLHPIVSLILLYGAYSLFGILGILLIPSAVVIINALLGKKGTSEVEQGTVVKTNGTKPESTGG